MEDSLGNGIACAEESVCALMVLFARILMHGLSGYSRDGFGASAAGSSFAVLNLRCDQTGLLLWERWS